MEPFFPSLKAAALHGERFVNGAALRGVIAGGTTTTVGCPARWGTARRLRTKTARRN